MLCYSKKKYSFLIAGHVQNNSRANRRNSSDLRAKRNRLAHVKNSSNGAAALVSSLGNLNDFEDEDTPENEINKLLEEDEFNDLNEFTETEGKNGGIRRQAIPIKVHKPAGELCVSVILVSECEILSDPSNRSRSNSNINTNSTSHPSNNKLSPKSSSISPRSLSGRNSPSVILGSPSSQENVTSRRHGVHRGFGDQDFHYAASRLRTVRKELGLKPMELFATIDENRSGEIDRQQFVDVMCRLDVNTTADEASLVFDHFDVDNSGVMDYNEFLKMMMGGEVLTKEIMNRHRLTDEERDQEEFLRKTKMYNEMGIDAVVDRLRMERRKRNLLPQTMFDLFDVDNNGSLSAEELEDALVRMKMPHTGLEVEGKSNERQSLKSEQLFFFLKPYCLVLTFFQLFYIFQFVFCFFFFVQMFISSLS